MKIKLEFEANEIEKVSRLTYYNNVMWKFIRHNELGLTHFKEIYDDVSDYPRYEFYIMNDGKFKYIAGGDGDPIPVESLGFGGVWISVDIHYPESLFNHLL